MLPKCLENDSYLFALIVFIRNWEYIYNKLDEK